MVLWMKKHLVNAVRQLLSDTCPQRHRTGVKENGSVGTPGGWLKEDGFKQAKFRFAFKSPLSRAHTRTKLFKC